MISNRLDLLITEAEAEGWRAGTVRTNPNDGLEYVWIPPGQKHWHGATASTSMTHIAIQENLSGKTVEWMEKVSDEQYGKVTSATKAPSTAQKLFGDFDPKLAELTDNVLFADVWERPGLSKRDRSLITVAALIALNRPEQLRSHLQRARENGVTKDEVVEVIHAFGFLHRLA